MTRGVDPGAYNRDSCCFQRWEQGAESGGDFLFISCWASLFIVMVSYV